MDFATLLIAGVLVAVAVGLWLVVMAMLQRQIEAVRSEGREGQEGLRRGLSAVRLQGEDGFGGLKHTLTTQLKGGGTPVEPQLQEGMGPLPTPPAPPRARLPHPAGGLRP